jgi:hypothetical protein
MGIEALLTSQVIGLDAALSGKLSLTGGTVIGQLLNALGTITASTPLTLTQTWNSGATTFTGILANITDTASASGSLLMDLQVGGSSKFNISKAGRLVVSGGDGSPYGIGTTGHLLQFPSMTGFLNLSMGTRSTGFSDRCQLHFQVAYNMQGFAATSEGFYVGSGCLIGFSSGNQKTNAPDVTLYRDAANTLAQRNSTNAQTFRVYNTYTSTTSYELGKIEWSSNVLRIGTEKGSAGGSARALELQTDGTTRLTIGTGGNVTATGYFTAQTNGFWVQSGATDVTYLDIVGLRLQSTQIIAFATSTNPATKTIGISRSADGVLEVNNGTIGTLRDLKLRAIELVDGNMVLGTTTGTKIGTATSQKIGFYDKTPVVQPTAVADATDAASVITQLNALLSRMRDLGLIAT